jgi:hypothetical protein
MPREVRVVICQDVFGKLRDGVHEDGEGTDEAHGDVVPGVRLDRPTEVGEGLLENLPLLLPEVWVV